MIVESKLTGEREGDVEDKLGGNSVPGERLFIGLIFRECRGIDSVDLDDAEDDQGWKLGGEVDEKLADIEGK